MGEKLVGCGQKIDEGKNPGKWWGAGEKLVGRGRKIPLAFFALVFLLRSTPTKNLTRSPLSYFLEQANICFD